MPYLEKRERRLVPQRDECMKVSTEHVWYALHEPIRSFIDKRIADKQSMEDLLQEVFLKIHVHIGTQGLSQKDLAIRLGLSFSGAKSRVQRARGKLKQLLLDCCHFELDRFGRVIDYQPRCGCCAQEACAANHCCL